MRSEIEEDKKARDVKVLSLVTREREEGLCGEHCSGETVATTKI